MLTSSEGWLVRAGQERLTLDRLAYFWHKNNSMSNTVPQKKRGRPATGQLPHLSLRLPEELVASVDKWAAKQKDTPSRSEAIRRLVEIGNQEAVGPINARHVASRCSGLSD